MGFLSGIGKAVGGIAKGAASVVGGLSSGLGALGGLNGVLGTLGTISSVASPFLNYRGQQIANAQTLASTKEQMDFQERMRDTQWQSAVKDLRKAGLNPMLAYGQGGNAAPGGASAIVKNEMEGAVNSAAVNRRLDVELKKIEADTNAANASAASSMTVARNQDSQAAVNAVNVAKIQQETQTSAATAAELHSRTGLQSVTADKIRAEISSIKTGISKMYVEMDNIKSSTSLTNQQKQNRIAELQVTLKQLRKMDSEIENIESNTELTRQEKINRYYEVLRINQQLDIGELAIPRMQNEADVQDGWYMKHIAPYLPDILKSTSSAANVKSMMK